MLQHLSPTGCTLFSVRQALRGDAQAIAEHTQQMVNTVSALMTANKSLVGEIEDVVQEMVRSVNVSCSEAHQPGSGED